MMSLKKILLFTGLISLKLEASDLIDPAEIKKNANAIDVIVAENFKLNSIAVPETTDDATFMRRAFLVSIGRMPTPKEALQFLELDVPNKRDLLVEYLYGSDGYKSHMTNWMYDIFTLREGYGSGPNTRGNGRLIDWIRDAVEVNMAWDDLCKELLTTKGNVHTGSGAAGYFAKGDAIDDHLSNTLRIFTGTRMECAQCHDDPFQEWEQMDFYQFKAFVSGGTTFKGKDSYNLRGPLTQLEVNDPKNYKNSKAGRVLHIWFDMMSIAGHGVNESKGAGRVALPDTYQYSDGDPGEMVGGRTAFGAKVRTSAKSDDKDSLNKFAAWMTSDQTPQFAITIGNRMWERVMGISLTPVTGDFVEPKDTNFQKLILKLAQVMKAYDYDLNTFQKTLMMTRTFQFVSSQKDLVNGEKHALDGRRAIRMSAEQIWDSMLSLAVANPDDLPKREKESTDYVKAGQLVMSKKELVNKVNGMNDAQLEKFILKTFDKLKKSEFPKADSAQDFGDDMMSFRSSNRNYGLRRASEISTPAPAGHFLQTFGQSGRDAAIDEASKEGTVSQALELLNGSVQRHIVHNPKASVNQVIDQITGDEERIKTVFLVVLNRVPDEVELELCLDIVNNSPDKRSAYRNIVGGLISSQEFYFIF